MQSTLSIKQTLAAPENTKWVIALLKADPPPNRNGLAKELCRRLELRDSKGDWQIATTSKALRELEDQGLWQLPRPRSQRAREWHPTRLNHPVPAPTELPELLQDARGLRLIEVADEEHLELTVATVGSDFAVAVIPHGQSGHRMVKVREGNVQTPPSSSKGGEGDGVVGWWQCQASKRGEHAKEQRDLARGANHNLTAR